MFSIFNVSERSGTGLCDLFHTWQINGFPKPDIIETVNPERVILELKTDEIEYTASKKIYL